MITPESSLGAAIRRARLAAGLTQKDLGARAGYKAGAAVSISRIENGTVTPPRDRVGAIASALGTPVGALTGQDGSGGSFHPSGAGTLPLKERRQRVEEEFLHRQQALTQAESDYFGAANLAQSHLTAPLVAVCLEFAHTLPHLEAATGANTAGPAAGDVKRKAYWALADGSSPDSDSAGDLVGARVVTEAIISGSLGDAGRSSAEGVLALVKRFGTASTGTPLGELRGAAQSKAALAQLGLGSRASGGLGMLGGRAVLGTVAVLPTVIAIGGVFALALIKGRREQEAKVTDAERFLSLTQRRYDEVIAHMTESAAIIATANTHGVWAFEAWREGLPTTKKPTPAWSDLNRTQQSTCAELAHVAERIVDLLALAPEDLLTASSEHWPTIGELAFGDGTALDQVAPEAITQDHSGGTEAPDEPTVGFDDLANRYRRARHQIRTDIRRSLGRSR